MLTATAVNREIPPPGAGHAGFIRERVDGRTGI